MVDKRKSAIWIAVQGPDGVGKSTAIELLKEHFNPHNVSILKAVGSGKFGVRLRDLYLSNTLTNGLKPIVSAFMHMEHFREVVNNLSYGIDTISDRYIGCFYAYNYKLLNQDNSKDTFDTLLNNRLVMGKNPDLIIHMDSSNDIIKDRLDIKDGNPLDDICMSNIEAVRDGYKEFYDSYTGPVEVIMNDGSIQDLSDHLYEAISPTLNK